MACGYLVIFLFGIATGSLLNRCIYRLPAGEPAAGSPPHCRVCGGRLAAADLISVAGYFLRRGRCRLCGAPLGSRGVIVEILTGGLFMVNLLVFGYGPELVKALVLTAFLLVVTFIDYDHQLILDKVLVALAGVGAVINLVFYYSHWGELAGVDPVSMVSGGLLAGGLLLVIASVARGGLGGGDIKFAAALGLWLGWQLALLTLCLAFLIGGAVGALLLVLRLKGPKDFIPYGPFIAAGAFLSLVRGVDIIAWYAAHWAGR